MTTTATIPRSLELSTGDTFNLAATIWKTRHLLPGTNPGQILDAASRLRHAADDAGLRTAGELLTNANHLVSAATGVSDLTSAPHAVDADYLHLIRNTLAAVIATAALATGDDVKAVLAAMPRLAPRSETTRRPALPDEILLCRIVASQAAQRDLHSLVGAATYALADAGAFPGETTAVYTAWFDDPMNPRTVHLPGHRTREAGNVPLDAWCVGILAELLRWRHLDDGDDAPYLPLTYRGREVPGSAKAQQSAQPSLDRILAATGIPTNDLTASSISKWRGRKTYTDGGSYTDVQKTMRARHTSRAVNDLRLPRTQRRKTTPVVTRFAA